MLRDVCWWFSFGLLVFSVGINITASVLNFKSYRRWRNKYFELIRERVKNDWDSMEDKTE